MATNLNSSINFKRVWEILIIVVGITYLLYIFFKENYGSKLQRGVSLKSDKTPNPNVPKIVIAGDSTQYTKEKDAERQKLMKEAAYQSTITKPVTKNPSYEINQGNYVDLSKNKPITSTTSAPVFLPLTTSDVTMIAPVTSAPAESVPILLPPTMSNVLMTPVTSAPVTSAPPTMSTLTMSDANVPKMALVTTPTPSMSTLALFDLIMAEDAVTPTPTVALALSPDNNQSEWSQQSFEEKFMYVM